MPLGKLILQLCALFIAGALIFGGYAWYRNSQVSDFEKVLSKYEPSTPAELLSIVDKAPAAVCRQSQASFQGASKVTSYHYDGKARFDFTDVTAGTTMHEVYNEDGLYVWSAASDSISLIRRELILSQRFDKEETERLYPVLHSLTCETWWNPDESVFRVPANLPIIEYGA